MKPLNVFILLAILAMLILTRLYEVGETETKGISLKNLIMYLAALSLIIVRKDYVRYVMHAPGLFFISLLMAWSFAGFFFMPFMQGGVKVGFFELLVSIKGQIFDPLLLYAVGFLLAVSDKNNTYLFQVYLVIFGILNIVALTVFITGINPFSISVVHAGTRFASYGGLSNHGAYMLIFLIPFFFYFIISGNKFSVKLFYMFLTLTTIIGIGLTGSRGGYLLITMLMLLMVVWTKRYMLFGLVLTSCVVALFLFVYLFDWEFFVGAVSRLKLLIDPGEMTYAQSRLGMSSFYDQVSAGRTWIWKSGFSILASDPIAIAFGKGLGTFPLYMRDQFGGPQAAHNLPFKLLFESGIIGLAIALSAAWCFFRFLRDNSRTQDRQLYYAVMCMLIVVSWYYMLSNAGPSYTVFGLGFGLLCGSLKPVSQKS